MPKQNRTVAVLYSGGLDSAALIGHFLNRGWTVIPVFIRAGLPWESVELYWTKSFLKKVISKRLKKLTLLRISLENAYDENWSQQRKIPGSYSRDEAVFLPARNLLLISKASLLLYSRHISNLAIGTLKGNPFPDGTRRFFNRLGELLSQSFRRPIKILTPFRNLCKADIIKRNTNLPLNLSVSCVAPRGRFHCGRCNKCAERKRAFKTAGIKDLTIYARG